MSGVDMGLWGADANDDGATAFVGGPVPGNDRSHSTWKPGVNDTLDSQTNESSDAPSQVGNSLGARENVPYEAVGTNRGLGVTHAAPTGHGGFVLPGSRPD